MCDMHVRMIIYYVDNCRIHAYYLIFVDSFIPVAIGYCRKVSHKRLVLTKVHVLQDR